MLAQSAGRLLTRQRNIYHTCMLRDAVILFRVYLNWHVSIAVLVCERTTPTF